MASSTHTAPTVVERPASRWARALSGEAEALGELAGSYWYPVYAWWRRAGWDDAGMLTQACFTRWLTEAPPRAGQAGAGRFREWVLAQLRELAEQGVEPVAEPAIELAEEWAAGRYAEEPEGAADEIFQRRWALTMLEYAMEALRAGYAERGQEALFTELSPYAGFEGGDDERYQATASRLQLSVGGARKAVFDFRSAHREMIRGLVADTVAEAADLESELTALLCALPGAPDQAPLPSKLRSFKPDELIARAMQSVRMTMSGGGLWTPPTDAEAAQLFPQFEMLGLLGRGGMGAVYKARQVSLDRLLAIKLLPLEISVDQDFADRFRREARAMAKLNHPGIIAVYDFGQTSEGHLYFSMPFVDGSTLHALIHGKRGEESPATLAPDVALDLVGQICDALAYAHEQGVVHRDIKPANVMVDLLGKVKVADFGLARMAEADPAQWGATMTGVVMGTPDYMAPEQKRGLHVDHRADIYALGVLLYEALCQETPQGVFEMPSKRRGLDKRLDAIMTKALATSPESRYQSVAEMKAALEPVLATAAKARTKATGVSRVTGKLTPATPGAPGRSRLPLAAGLAIVLAALAGGAFFFLRPKPPAAPPAPAISPATPRPTVASVENPVAEPIARPRQQKLKRFGALMEKAPAPPPPSTPVATPTPAPKPASTPALAGADFHALFDGKTFTGWKSIDGGNVPADWTIADGAILGGAKRSCIVCAQDFGDFELELEWRVSATGNGGVFYHTPHSMADDRPRGSPQMQLASPSQSYLYTPGSLVDAISATEDASLPPGQWNRVRLLVRGSTAEHWINGRLVCRYDTADPGWPKIVAASKYPEVVSQYASHQRGAISLKSWAQEIAYRNIRIRSLDVEPRLFNLRSVVDVSRDARKGEWSKTPDALTVQSVVDYSVLELPYTPPEEYDLDVEFTPNGPGLNVNEYLTAQGHSFAFKLNAHNRTPPLYGFELLDGKFIKDFREAAAERPLALEVGKRVNSHVEVRRKGLRAVVNGALYVTWSGDFARFSMEPGTKLRDDHHLGVGSYKRPVTFHRILVREISGPGKFDPGVSAPP